MGNSIRAIAITAILVGASSCVSANTTFTLNNVAFSDGATATGSFTINTAFNALISWSIDVTGSDLGPPSANYDYMVGNSNYFNISPTEVALASSPFAQDLVLVFNSSLAGGGMIGLNTSSTVDCDPQGACGSLQSGSATMVTPEPASMLLASPILGFLGLILYRRKRMRDA
jgi:hypothetical protein